METVSLKLRTEPFTQYLVDDCNLTGYAQVLEELSTGTVQRVYTYGLNRLSQSQASGTSFYGYDGHGSVRILMDSSGAITDRYDYDAFGTALNSVGSTANVYRDSGEQFDSDLQLVYQRARYRANGSGRFLSADPLLGSVYEPASLTRYAYASNDPVDLVDPTRRENEGALGTEVHALIGEDFRATKAAFRFANYQTLQDILFAVGPNPCVVRIADCLIKKPDLTDFSPSTKQVFEIKPISSFWQGYNQLNNYLDILDANDLGADWSQGTIATYNPPDTLPVAKYNTQVKMFKPENGAILYQVVESELEKESEKASRGLKLDQTLKVPDLIPILPSLILY